MAHPARRTGRLHWLRRGRRDALVAAAAQSFTETQTGSRRASPFEALHQDWQTRVFSFYDRMGECWNPGQFAARSLAKIRLYAAIRDGNGDPVEVTQGWAADLVASWGQIPESYGRLMSLIGEGRLCQSLPPDERDEAATPTWEFLSPTELRVDRDGRKIQRKLGGGVSIEYRDISLDGGGDPAPGEMRMWRFWTPHPQNSGLPDSAFRGVLEYYEQLWWLTLSERADLQNRIVDTGLLLVPKEIEFDPPAAENQAAAEDSEVDPFNELLHDVMTARISNPGTAEAATPPVIRADSDLLHPDKFRLLRLYDPQSSLYVGSREDALIRRIALGLDLPAAEIEGVGSLNHWNAWKNDDAKYEHVQPTIEALLRDLTEGVLRPIGLASGQADAAEVFVAADVAALVSDPDKGKTAIVLYKEGVISAAATRDANDFDDDDAMGDDEREEWVAIRMRSPELLGGGDGISPEQSEEPPEEPDTVEPDEQASTLGRMVVTSSESAAWASLATWLRSRRRSCPQCWQESGADTADDRRLLAVLGRDRLGALGVTEEKVIERLRDSLLRNVGHFGCEITSVGMALKIAESYFRAHLYDMDGGMPGETAEALAETIRWPSPTD